jgi:hypothetical protein
LTILGQLKLNFFFILNLNLFKRAIEQCSKNQQTQQTTDSNDVHCNIETSNQSEVIQSAFRPIAQSSTATAITSSTFHQISAHIPTQNPSNYTSLIAYPNKWFLPIPVTMSHHHLSSFPRCTLANCSLCLHHPAAI